MPEPADRIPLETFLADLTEEQANDARAAAERMDELERRIGPPGWLERNLISLALIALAFFVVGVGALIGAFSWLRSVMGMGGITLFVACFPGLIFAYLYSVRGRTAVDRQKMALNERHFLPLGGLYFSGLAHDTDRPGQAFVLRVAPPEQDEPTLRDKVEAQYASAKRWHW